MPHPRMTKRRITTVTVVATLVLLTGAYGMVRVARQRANHFRQRASFHARRAAMFKKSIITKERAARDCEAYGGARMLEVARDYRAAVKLCVKLADYHAGLIPKYERAAAQPWLPVGPDPPEPAP
jgi:hypothetical protein